MCQHNRNSKETWHTCIKCSAASFCERTLNCITLYIEGLLHIHYELIFRASAQETMKLRCLIKLESYGKGNQTHYVSIAHSICNMSDLNHTNVISKLTSTKDAIGQYRFSLPDCRLASNSRIFPKAHNIFKSVHFSSNFRFDTIIPMTHDH